MRKSPSELPPFPTTSCARFQEEGAAVFGPLVWYLCWIIAGLVRDACCTVTSKERRDVGHGGMVAYTKSLKLTKTLLWNPARISHCIFFLAWPSLIKWMNLRLDLDLILFTYQASLFFFSFSSPKWRNVTVRMGRLRIAIRCGCVQVDDRA